MKEFEIVVQNQTGLHARPAKTLASLAKEFQSNIWIWHGEKKVNAKSLVSLLTLGVECGSSIRVMVEGDDEGLAHETLYQAIQTGLGEEIKQEEKINKVIVQPTIPAAVVEKGVLQGAACSPGIVIGPIFQFAKPEIVIDETNLGTEQESARFKQALEAAAFELRTLLEHKPAGKVGAESAIIEVHIELLEDQDLSSAVLDQIQKGASAAQAWEKHIKKQAEVLQALSDPLLAARAADLQDVGGRVLRILVGAEPGGVQLPDHPVIIAAKDLSPSDTASLDKTKIMGICLAEGGTTSHTAIIARASGFPAAIGLGPELFAVQDETQVILNGDKGTLTVSPEPDVLEKARKSMADWQNGVAAAKKEAAQPAVTQDGHRVEVAANIGGLEEAKKAPAAGAEAVGLLRTEFLFLDRQQAPTETEQYEVYAGIASALQGRPVIVRTMDIGGDKPLPYISLPVEANPFLGVRGLRLSLKYPELLEQQLRAIFRAASSGKLRIMFPMVGDVQEWRAAKQMVEKIRKEVNGPELETGIMVEVPSAALLAGVFAKEVDFFSIGTNDLTQYTMAMDRSNPDLAKKSDGLHPAVLRLISLTCEAAHRAKRWVGICGELGADAGAVPILVGLGVDELSVNLNAIPLVKQQVRGLNYRAARDLAERALMCESAAEVRALSAGMS
jgi:phosphocarrier protein FPr